MTFVSLFKAVAMLNYIDGLLKHIAACCEEIHSYYSNRTCLNQNTEDSNGSANLRTCF